MRFCSLLAVFYYLSHRYFMASHKSKRSGHFLPDLMAKLKYYYNPKTFEYDRAKRNVWGVVSYIFGVLLVSGGFFAGIFFLDNLLFETEHEAQLRFENKSLKKHKTLLTSQLTSMEGTLASLKKEDKKLYAKIFNIQSEDSTPKQQSLSSDLSFASLSTFRRSIDKVQSSSSNLYQHSQVTNQKYNTNPLSKDELNALATIPTFSPVDLIYVSHLVSGFGERINPFHKGNYQHPGIDFSIPRGSAIYATASGRITTVKKSDLQAGYGSYIEIDHGNGYQTRYAHLDNPNVKVGQAVRKGEQIATSGMSGGSISPHLHYEVILYNENVDPVKFLIQGVTPDVYSSVLVKAKTKNQSLD
jgi:murein DD-endopeptidase MepM/ murein hydrolase activator NlpD